MYFSKVSFFSFIAAFGLVKVQMFTGQGTFYAPGLGSCGQTHSEYDFIAALNAPQYDAGGGSDCGRRIRIFYQGKSVDVTIVDRCAGCIWGDVDLSPAAFNTISTPDAGRIPIAWQYI